MDKVSVKALLEEVSLKVMGQALDQARMSELSERAFKQFERSIRAHTRQCIQEAQKMVDEAPE